VTRRLLVLLLSAGLALTACGSSTGSPVSAAAPTQAPGCAKPALIAVSTNGLVTVDPDPIGAVLIWYPDMNEQPCRTVRTTLTSTPAVQLAADVRAAPKFPSGTFNCPAAFGVEVDAYFSYKGQSQAQLADISLSGCRGIDAPGRSTRRYTDQLGIDLKAVAPPDWIKYF
jgi:hypothetical protein